jgi:TolB protein
MNIAALVWQMTSACARHRLLVTTALVFTVVASGSANSAIGGGAPTLLFQRSPGDQCLSDLYSLRTDGSAVERLTYDSQHHARNVFSASFGGQWSPDGQQIVFTREQTVGDCAHPDTRDDVFVMWADGSGVRRLTNDGGAGGASFSPDGNRLAFSQGGSIVVSNTSATHRRVIARGAYGAEWSPDGSRILYASDTALWVFDLMTGRRWHVAGRSGDYFETPSWSPDGTKIIFARELQRSGRMKYELWQMRWDGSRKKQVTSPAGENNDECPVWSPDGKQIAFTRSSDRDSKLILVGKGGTRSVAHGGAGAAGCPVWSPDGSVIAFAKSCGDWTTLWVVRRDGSAPRRLTTCHSDSILAWRP